ncbi:hypothetical protein N506_0385 [Lactobacillus gasseri DSM 14869]|nr:hypothetical protein N506_0385 [Lactobacillus gasseri DSM 14869]
MSLPPFHLLYVKISLAVHFDRVKKIVLLIDSKEKGDCHSRLFFN